MAFAKEEPYNHIDASDFCIDHPEADRNDPDATSGRADGSRTLRNGFGSTLWRYAKPVTTYDPVSGHVQSIFPARQLMLAYLTRWMRDFRIDGIRMDSVENVANWDFVQTFKDLARTLLRQRWTDAGLDAAAGADARFLVVGEIALALVLLVAATLALQSFARLLRVDLGFRPSHLVTMRMDFPRYRFAKSQQAIAFVQQILRTSQAIPGVDAVSAGLVFPMGDEFAETTFETEESVKDPKSGEQSALSNLVAPNFFRALGIPLLAGRDFRSTDTDNNSLVFIVNEALAHKFFGSIDVLGKRKLVRPFIDVGHNPLLMYVLFNVLINSALEMIPPMRGFMEQSLPLSFCSRSSARARACWSRRIACCSPKTRCAAKPPATA